jgi:outer membrane protein OmpA-like peptidoglycan-associated protein
MVKTTVLKKRIAFGIILGVCAILANALPALSQAELPSTTQTMEGGRGLLFMQSARTFGNAAFVIGVKGLYERRDYPVFWKNSNNTDNSTILGVPLTLGIGDYLDVTGSIFGFHDVRPYKANLRYGIADYGIGSTHLGAKLRYPFEMDYPIQLALKLGAMFDTSKLMGDGLNYRWTRKGTDYDGSLLQTFDLGKSVSLHFEEGVTKSGSVFYDDQWVGAAGIEYHQTDRLTWGLEANNRTFDGKSPQSVFQAGLDPAKYWGGTPNVGSAYYVKDKKADRMKDFFIIAPSLSYHLTDNISFDLGAAVNIADQKDPKETVQVAFGLSYGTVIPWLADSDKDGVRNSIDREPNTPKGYPVDQFGVSLDTDKDGVPDGRDQQPNTPLGAKVDSRGVAIDSDGDGVPDGIDKEPNTPKGYPVDKWGVSLDTDGDGVPDGKDKQPNTPKGYPVDEFGVALDTDGDGVPDGKDKQPNTPKGYPVDEWGVALDTDGDGVPDGKDLEPNTPKGSMVDEYGRAIKEKEKTFIQEGIIRLNAVYFDVGKAVVKPESFDALNEVTEILIKYPTLKIEIQGHTDNTGSAAMNRQLSQKRAQAVLDYILKRDPNIKSTNFTVVGYGPDRPIADNKTAEGKQLNRRVEFVVLNKEELKRVVPIR